MKHHLLRFPLLPAAVLAAYSSDQQQQLQHVLYPASICPWEPFGIWASQPAACTAPPPPQIDSFQWIKGDICHELPGGGSDLVYCSYTLPAFANGLGISIITSTDLFTKLSALPVFNSSSMSHQPATTTPPPPPPYQAVPIPNKGIGLVATQPLAANTVFLTRTPAVMLDDTAFNRLGVARLSDLLLQAADQLPAHHGREYFNLTTHVDVASRAERAYHVFMRNNFQTPVEDVGVFHSAFTQVSRLNHACRPNSEYFFDDVTFSHNVFAARDVAPGQELTITYSDPIQTHAARQVYLHQHWGFRCTCDHCTTASPDSDARITEIHALWSVLDDYQQQHHHDDGSTASPAKAERLIALYEQEGLVTRMVEAYYRAAVEWNGVGDAHRARDYALRSVAAGRVMESGIRPFLGNMRALAADPEAHWTWRFRLAATGDE